MKKWMGMLLALVILLTISGSVIGSAAQINMCEELESKANDLLFYDVGTVAPGGNFSVNQMPTFAFWRIDNVDQYVLPMEEGNVDGYEVYVIPAEVLENVLLSHFANFDLDALHNLTAYSVDPETWQWVDNFRYYDPDSNTYTIAYPGGIGGEMHYSITGYEVEGNIYTAYLTKETIYFGEGEPDSKEYDYYYDGKYYWIRLGYLKAGFLQEDTLKYYSWEESEEPYAYGELITPDTEFLPEVSIEIVDATVVAYESCLQGAVDEETGKTNYTYNWSDHCTFDVVIEGKRFDDVSVDALCNLVYEVYNLRVHGFLIDDQSEVTWEPGNSYTCTLGLNTDRSAAEVWRQEVTVELKESSVKIEILSDLVLDELMYDEIDEGDGRIWKYYHWEEYARVDFSIDGVKYENRSLGDLNRILMEQDIPVSISFGHRSSGDQDEKDPFNQNYENQWEIGQIATVDVSIRHAETGEQLLQNVPVKLVLAETAIVSVSAEPLEYYVYQGYRYPAITLNYKDGSTSCWYGIVKAEGEWPETAGEYTVYITVFNKFRVPVQVTVLPNPTSGVLADTLSWKIDEKTGALIFSGTGAEEVDKEALSELTDLLIETDSIKTAVFKDGIEYLPEGMLAYGLHIEELVLPNSLKELPAAMLGNNGPTEGAEHLGWDSNGVSTLVVPESVTSWTKLFYYYSWGITDIYLPAGLTELNPENLCYMQFFRENGGLGDAKLPAYQLNVHFAGTQEQWNAIKYAVSDDDYTLNFSLKEMGLDDAEMKRIMNSINVTFNDPAPSYGKESIKVDEGVASVPDSIVEIKKDEDVVIDITETYETVESVVLGSATVDKIVEAETSVQVKLPDATVSLDKTAIGTLSDKAGTAAVTIVAKNIKTETLTEKQTEALKEKEVLVCLNLEAYAGEKKISDFGGGKVTVSVPFTVPAEKKGSDFCVAYIDDNGKMTAMPTTYKDGILVFETTHFSEYVVLEKSYLNDNPPTGDNGIAMVLALMTVSAAAVILLGKKKAF